MAIIHSNEANNKILEQIANTTLQNYVIAAAQMAYHVNTLNTAIPRLFHWVRKATDYLTTHAEHMLPAFYGYAVEELTNAAILYNHRGSIWGYSIHLQVAVGHTIPDIILRDAFGKDVAWMDITSEGSIGHIFNKCSSGWYTKPFIAELTYPAFSKDCLAFGEGDGISSRIKALSIQRQLDLYEAKYMEYFRENFENSLRNLYTLKFTYTLSQSLVASTIERCFNLYFNNSYKHPIINSMIQIYLERFGSFRDTDIFVDVKNLYSNSKHDKAEAISYIIEAYNKSQTSPWIKT